MASLRRVIEEIRNSPDNKNKGDADAGAVVMLDVRTGEILALASYPDYDPKDFIDQKTVPEAAERVAAYLTDNINKPLWNRAVQEIYAPGSTLNRQPQLPVFNPDQLLPLATPSAAKAVR